MGASERRASSVKHVRITFAQDSKPYRFQRLDAIAMATMASDESSIAGKASDITCGVCRATIAKQAIKSHQCVQQWHGITIESDSQIFYPTNERGECLARVICDGKEQIVLINKESLGQSYLTQQIQIDNEVAKSNLSVDDCCSSDDDSQTSVLCSTAINKTILDELLIEEVRKRPPIYDYTLPLSFRGRYKVVELWKEISNALKGHYSAEEAKKRWKSLKDTYSKLVADEKKPSGSARSQQTPWKHFEAMSFLRSVSKHKPSISNLTVPIRESNNTLVKETGANNSEEFNQDEPPAKRRAKTKDDLSASMSRIAEAVCKKDMPAINLPKPPEIDALDGMFIYIKQILLSFNKDKQNILLLKFLQDITKEKQNERE